MVTDDDKQREWESIEAEINNESYAGTKTNRIQSLDRLLNDNKNGPYAFDR